MTGTAGHDARRKGDSPSLVFSRRAYHTMKARVCDSQLSATDSRLKNLPRRAESRVLLARQSPVEF